MVVDCPCYCQPFLGSQPGASPICRFDLPVNHQHIRFWYFLSSHLHYSRALGLRADQCIIWKRLAEWMLQLWSSTVSPQCPQCCDGWCLFRCFKCMRAFSSVEMLFQVHWGCTVDSGFGLCFNISVSSKAELTWRLCGKVVDGCVTICSCVCCYDLQRVHWFGDYGGCNRLSFVFLRLYLYPSFIPESIYTCRSCAWTLWHNHIISTLQVVNPFHTILCNAGFDSLTVDGSVQSSEVTWDPMDGNRHVVSNRSYDVLIVVSTEPLQHYIPNWSYDAKPLIC